MKADAPKSLVEELDGILDACMGVRFPFRDWTREWKAWHWSIGWLVAYGLVWLAIDAFALAPRSSEPKLVSLLAWGAGYFACAMYFAHTATERITESVRCDILPYAEPGYEEAVAEALRDRFPPGSLLTSPLLIAALSLEAAWWAIGHDIDRTWRLFGWLKTPESAFWAASYFIYFWTAGVAVIAARFYSSFADELNSKFCRFYVLGASDTPLVKGLSKLGSQVLTFWALIFLLILSGMLIALVPPNDYRFDRSSLLLFLMVPIAGFFSLGVGTLVYLGAEARIRATVRRFTHAQVKQLQKESNAILHPGEGRVPGKTDRTDCQDEVDRLMEWQDRILAGGRYGSRVGAGLSIALPLALPVVGLIVNLVK